MLSYTDVGRGRTAVLLLVHGFPLDRTIWEPQIGELSKRRRVVAPDVRGHGKSPAPEGAYAMEDLARELLDLMARLGVERFAAAGHSMGGYILFAMHRLAPARLERLGLIATRAGADADEARRARLANADRALKEGTGFLAETMSARALRPDPDPAVARRVREIVLRTPPAGVAGALRGMAARPDSTPQLASIRVPTLVLAGAQDQLVPPAESRAMAAAIPGARLVEVEGSGHLPTLERPAETLRALEEWLR
jgi:pimeloyl-ACP methyl ester carboxylesterase